jgi:hypothetical protein
MARWKWATAPGKRCKERSREPTSVRASRCCSAFPEARDFPARSVATFRTRSGQLARSRQESRAQEGGQLRPLREAPRDPAIGRVPLL